MAITFNGKKFLLKARSQDFHETVTTFLEFSISSSCSPIGIGSTLDSWWRILALPNLCYRWLHLIPSSKSFVPTDNDNISLKPFTKLFCDIAQLAHTLRIKDFNQCLPIKNELWFEYVVTGYGSSLRRLEGKIPKKLLEIRLSGGTLETSSSTPSKGILQRSIKKRVPWYNSLKNIYWRREGTNLRGGFSVRMCLPKPPLIAVERKKIGRQSAVKAPGYLLLTRNGHTSNIVEDTPNPCDGLHYFEEVGKAPCNVHGKSHVYMHRGIRQIESGDLINITNQLA
ncbi:hypothetical protein VNO77_37013 [Canavalia gladiata]|uniref:Uncharacterized protein n=1 Tax=Canavalia gladiata TaxID=3824 RepID=A0AAN9KAE2_CANGL